MTRLSPLLFLSLFILFVSFSLAQVSETSVPSTAVPSTSVAPNATKPAIKTWCVGDCGGRGRCQVTGVCNCWRGFVNTKNATTGQSQCLDTMIRGNEALLTAMRVIFSVTNGILIFPICWRIYLEFRTSEKHQRKGISSLTKYVLGALLVDTVFQFFNWALDFRGAYGVGHPVALILLAYIEYPDLILIFSFMLCHWIELYKATCLQLKKAEMLSKVNTRYQANVTIEDVLRTVSDMRKVKIGFCVLVFLAYAVYLIFEFCAIFQTTREKFTSFLFFVAWYAGIWVIYFAGYVYYGRKLAKLMPAGVGDKVILLTKKVAAVSLIMLIMNLFSLASNIQLGPVSTATVFLAKSFVVAGLTTLTRWLCLDIYMPFTSIGTWFTSFLSTRSSGGTSSGGKSGKDKTMEVSKTSAEPQENDIDLSASNSV